MCLLFCPQNDSSDSESLVLDVILGLSLYKPQGLGGGVHPSDSTVHRVVGLLST